jgi:hypothetical protein
LYDVGRNIGRDEKIDRYIGTSEERERRGENEKMGLGGGGDG